MRLGAKNDREGNHGTAGKISYPVFPTHLKARLPCPVSHSCICCVHIPVQSAMLPTLREQPFTLAAKGILSLGRLLCASCFQRCILNFQKGLCYQYNYSHFTEDITAAESLPVFSEISHVNYIFTPGIHLSIYLSPFRLLSGTTLY